MKKRVLFFAFICIFAVLFFWLFFFDDLSNLIRSDMVSLSPSVCIDSDNGNNPDKLGEAYLDTSGFISIKANKYINYMFKDKQAGTISVKIDGKSGYIPVKKVPGMAVYKFQLRTSIIYLADSAQITSYKKKGYLSKGVVGYLMQLNDYGLWDSCISDSNIREYYCSGNIISSVDNKCSLGCKEGACIKPAIVKAPIKCISGKMDFGSELLLIPNGKGELVLSNESLGIISSDLRNEIYGQAEIKIDANASISRNQSTQSLELARIMKSLANYSAVRISKQANDKDNSFEDFLVLELNKKIKNIEQLKFKPQLKILFNNEMSTSIPVFETSNLLSLMQDKDGKGGLSNYTLAGVKLLIKSNGNDILFEYDLRDKSILKGKINRLSDLANTSDYLSNAKVGFVYDLLGNKNISMCASNSTEFDKAVSAIGGDSKTRRDVEIAYGINNDEPENSISIVVLGGNTSSVRLGNGISSFASFRF